MCLNHPETIPQPPSVEKLSSTKPVPSAKKVGYCCPIGLRMLHRSQRSRCMETKKNFLKGGIYPRSLVEIDSMVKTNDPSDQVHLCPGIPSSFQEEI